MLLWTGYLTCLGCIEPVVGNLSFLPRKRVLNASSNVVVGKICSVNVRVVMPTDHSNFVAHCVSSKLILRDWSLPLMICVKLLSLVFNNVPHCDRWRYNGLVEPIRQVSDADPSSLLCERNSVEKAVVLHCKFHFSMW